MTETGRYRLHGENADCGKHKNTFTGKNWVIKKKNLNTNKILNRVSDLHDDVSQTILKINYDLVAHSKRKRARFYEEKSQESPPKKRRKYQEKKGKEKGKKDKESKGTKGSERGRKGKGKGGKREGRGRKKGRKGKGDPLDLMMMVHDNSSEQHDGEDNERDEEGVPSPEETIDSVLTIVIKKNVILPSEENVGDIIARNPRMQGQFKRKRKYQNISN
ncbi:hypothetical protein RhiirC2_844174 [Rhizophagus irregularis]|uniref:Uncharacterized protein n=1 Tax=Rhizophagus irregularis TaxID=588596 RepID=A0A2N1NUR7_9GLOM|nr:hypothetical protein RhiirC2_844174 [Rhizophagus irregularis]